MSVCLLRIYNRGYVSRTYPKASSTLCANSQFPSHMRPYPHEREASLSLHIPKARRPPVPARSSSLWYQYIPDQDATADSHSPRG